MNDLPYLRTSERGSFKRCIQQWFWSYRMGLRTNAVKPDALWFGTGIHLALAEYYPPGMVRGADPRETWERYCGDTLAFIRDNRGTGDPEQAEWVDAKKLGAAMMEGYVQRYRGDPSWEVISPEYAFHVLIGRPSPVINYVGTFDGVIRDHADGKIKLMEHKTAATISTSHLVLDDQAGSYWAVATHELRHQGKIGPKESLYGIEYNFMRKGMPDDRPRTEQGLATNQPTKPHYIAALTGLDGWTEADLKKLSKDGLESIAAALMLQVLGEVSKVQPAPLFLRTTIRRTAKERQIQLDRIQDEVEHMNLVRTGELPITKTPTRECVFCPFVEMCELHEQGGDWESYQHYAYHQEDPYADHRVDAVSSKFLKVKEPTK
jgi:hypothetical protein